MIFWTFHDAMIWPLYFFLDVIFEWRIGGFRDMMVIS